MSAQIFLIAWHDGFNTALERYFRFALPQGRHKHAVNTFRIPETLSFEGVLNTYESISDLLETSASPADLRQSTAILALPLQDLIQLNIRPNPLSITEQKKSPAVTLASMLILTFPEVHWIFFGGDGPAHSATHAQELRPHHLSSATLRERFALNSESSQLFDPSGLRNYIRRCVNEGADTRTTLPNLPLRDELAAAIDDEEPYAFLHGYLAYKLGYRCHMVTTEAMMEHVFISQKEGAAAPSPPKVDLAFEDMFLNFPDRSTTGMHLSRLKKRDALYNTLEGVEQRIFVTAGHKHIDWHEDNQTYLESLRSKGKTVRLIYKPTGGIYNILESGRLLSQYWRRHGQEMRNAKPSNIGTSAQAGGHSAPGRLLLIAEKLIGRAESLLREGHTVQDCLHGATLALEAQEFLSFRTPTTSLEAIALRHQLEVKAECMFYGIGYSKDVKNRFREIEDEVNAVARWFHPSLRKRSALNAQMSVLTEVMRIFREYGQFDEEQQCLNHLRKLNRRGAFWKRPWLGIFYPIRWYIETLVGSFSLFIVALLTWPIIFGVAGWFIAETFGTDTRLDSLSDYITHGYIMFFGLQPLGFPRGPGAQPLTFIMLFMGFVHLGIFISHLYTLISRR